MGGLVYFEICRVSGDILGFVDCVCLGDVGGYVRGISFCL